MRNLFFAVGLGVLSSHAAFSTSCSEMFEKFRPLFPKSSVEIEGKLLVTKAGQGLSTARVSFVEGEKLIDKVKVDIKKLSLVKKVVVTPVEGDAGHFSDWKVVLDYKTVSGENGKFSLDMEDGSAFEVQASKMKSKESRLVFLKFLGSLKKHGFQSAPETGGVHLHFDIRNRRLEDVQRFYLRYQKIEKALVSLFSPSKGRNGFKNYGVEQTIGSIRKLERILKDGLRTKMSKIVKKEKESDDFFTFSSKISSVALRLDYGTLEVRLANSTIEPEEVASIHVAMERLLAALLSKDSSLGAKLETASNLSEDDALRLLREEGVFDGTLWQVN